MSRRRRLLRGAAGALAVLLVSAVWLAGSVLTGYLVDQALISFGEYVDAALGL